MWVGFGVITLCALIFAAIGVSCLKSKEAVGFFTFTAPPKVAGDKVKGYNRAVGILWFVFAGIIELLLGIPMLMYEQNSPILAFASIGVMFLVIAAIVAYLQILNHFSK